jgi:hypothetical protein
MRLTLITILTATLLFGLTGCKDETTAKGEGDTKLTIVEPDDLSIQRGQTAKLTITIEREDMEKEVEISFSELPDGVEVVDADKKIVGEEGVYTFQAGNDASIVSGYEVGVTAKAGDLEAQQSFSLEVTSAE